MNLGDVDVVVELIVSKRKKKPVIEMNLQQKQEIKKLQEKRTFSIFYFKFHIYFSVTAQFLMLKIQAYFQFYICE